MDFIEDFRNDNIILIRASEILISQKFLIGHDFRWGYKLLINWLRARDTNLAMISIIMKREFRAGLDLHADINITNQFTIFVDIFGAQDIAIFNI